MINFFWSGSQVRTAQVRSADVRSAEERNEKLMSSHYSCAAVVFLTLGLLFACGRPPAENAADSNTQKLPFDRSPRPNGVSPSQSLIPSTTKLPEGTPIPVRLRTVLSSASAHAGDTFSATIEEPVVIDGQTLLDRGTSATGRVIEAKAAASSRGGSAESSTDPGYLRVVLVSLDVGDKKVMVYTSSIFAKGAAQKDRTSKNIEFGVDRRLNFRLAQTVDLQ